MRTLSALLIGLLWVTASAAELPLGVERVLTGLRIAPEDVSILVQEVDSEEPLLSHLADAPRNPASVMKLVTTWTALELLGPAYTWPTEVYFDGDFDGRTLHGDLGIKGYGDPAFVIEEFWSLLRMLRGLGLHVVEGDLVLDGSHFDLADEESPSDFDGEPYRTYNVLPSALLTNFKAVQFQFFADAANKRVNIAMDPELGNLEVQNRIRLVPGPCRGFQAGISFHVDDPEALSRVIFEGEYSASCGNYRMGRTVLAHDTYLYGLFKGLWEPLGGHLRGGLRSDVIGTDARLVLTWRSPPLADVIRDINKNSNNVMTRQLVYSLAAERNGPPGTRTGGGQIIRDHMASRGLDVDPLVIVNGAGLSRDERISARLLVDMLRLAYRGPFGAEFVSSLSLGGLDGTTRRRFNGKNGAGQMHVKTGRIDDVSALAGYAHSASGKTYIVAIFANFELAHRGPGRELEEAVMQWVYAL
jgi:D-alanyl-D-alanine carboxypeptidase/D-alanyl-D-alanine-endopeptidase (penicillin-binding protein 4)